MSDIFISYKTNGGDDLARFLYKSLTGDGYDVFADVERLDQGYFDEALHNEILRCRVFLLILSSGALDGCQDPEDWVRKECELALRYRKRIIPVMKHDFRFPEDLPESMSRLKNSQGVVVYHGYHYEAVAKIEALLGDLPSRVQQECPQVRKRKRSKDWEKSAWGLDEIECPICHGTMAASGTGVQMIRYISEGCWMLRRWITNLGLIYGVLMFLSWAMFYFDIMKQPMLKVISAYTWVGRLLCLDEMGCSRVLMAKNFVWFIVVLTIAAVVNWLLELLQAWLYRRIIERGWFTVEYSCVQCRSKRSEKYSSDEMNRWFKLPVHKGEALYIAVLATVTVPPLIFIAIPFCIVPLGGFLLFVLVRLVIIGICFLRDLKKAGREAAASAAAQRIKGFFSETKQWAADYIEALFDNGKE